MRRITSTPNARKSIAPTWLENFEQISAIIDRHWIWLPKLIAIILCSIYLAPEISWKVSSAIIVLGRRVSVADLAQLVWGKKSEETK